MSAPVPPDAPHGDPAPQQQGYAPLVGAGEARGPGGLAVAALVVGVVAFLVGLVPFLGLLAGAAAVVLGIVVLRRSSRGSGLARVFGVVGIVGGGLAVLASLATTGLFAVGASGALDRFSTASAPDLPAQSQPAAPSDAPTPSPSDSPSTPAEPQLPSGGPGEAVAGADGVSYTVTNLACGLPTLGEDPFTVAAQGQFCVVDVAVANGSSAPVDFSPVGAAAYAGEVQFAPSIEGSIYADVSGAPGSINPGQSQPAKVAFDVPAGTALDRVELTDSYDDPGVSIRLS